MGPFVRPFVCTPLFETSIKMLYNAISYAITYAVSYAVRFKKVQEGSRRFQKVPKGSSRFQKV